ncbi:MAG: iron-sulfur cluster insertion protein ErpA [Gammaproteobacteria bacterium]|nr:iron-sulfur cluster insertion protein ErpA [Gammaproteobacteria bacterium]
MSSDDTNTLAPLALTDSAAQRVGELIAAQGNAELKLRVYVQGGGCSGFQYGFALEQEQSEDDTVVENAGVTMLVDPLSFQYLMGAQIDYKDDLQGARFIVHNPNATTTCGCGSSFST